MKAVFFVVAALLIVHTKAVSAPLEPVVSFQGELRDGGDAAQGSYDFVVDLFNVESGGVSIDTLVYEDVQVNDGLFVLDLDFTSAPFEMSEQYWLEVGVRPGSSNDGYTTLVPRARLAPAAYAINALSVASQSVGSEQIDATEVQVRVSGSCAVGSYVREVSQDGTVLCESDDDTTYSGTDFAVSNQSCSVGEVVTSVDANGNLVCAVDSDTTYSGTDFAVSNQSCSVGEVVTSVDANGNLVCAVDSDTTYSGADFVVSNQSCSVGEVVTSVDASGNLVCAVDTDTTYSGTDFALSNQSCSAGQVVTSVDANGNLVCAADSDTTYSGTDFALSNQSCSVGQVVTSVDANGNLVCAADSDTTYSGTDFAVSNQSCSVGQVVTSVDANGNLVCAVDADTTYSGADFALSDQSCGSGEVVAGVDASGVVQCAQRPVFATERPAYAFLVYEQGSNDVGNGLDMVLGADGLAVLSHIDLTSGSLLVTHCEDSLCLSNTTTIVDTSVGAGTEGYTSIDIAADGYPIIGYYDIDDANLRFAKCNDVACAGFDETLVTIDTVNDVGKYVSIGEGISNRPTFAYYDATMGNLRWAQCAAEDCSGSITTETVDSSDDVGSHASMVMDGTQSQISYYDATSMDLKYVRCAVSSCAIAIPRTIASTGNVGREAHLLRNFPIDLPTVIYWDDAEDVQVTVCSGTLCTTSTTSATDTVFGGRPPAAAVTADGLPLLVVPNVFSSSGPLAWVCDDSHCTSGTRKTLPRAGTGAGKEAAIVIGLDGFPLIAVARGSGGIDMVRCGSRDCS